MKSCRTHRLSKTRILMTKHQNIEYWNWVWPKILQNPPRYKKHIEYEVEKQWENSISFPLTDTRKCLYNELYPEAKISPALDSQFNYKQQKSLVSSVTQGINWQCIKTGQLTSAVVWNAFQQEFFCRLFVIILRMVRILSGVYKTSFVLWEHRICSENGRRPAQELQYVLVEKVEQKLKKLA